MPPHYPQTAIIEIVVEYCGAVVTPVCLVYIGRYVKSRENQRQNWSIHVYTQRPPQHAQHLEQPPLSRATDVDSMVVLQPELIIWITCF